MSEWLNGALDGVAREPSSVSRVFPQAGRKVGRGAARPDVDPSGVVHGTVDDDARAALVVALADATDDDELARTLDELYRRGDTAERRGVLRGLDALTRRAASDAPVARGEAVLPAPIAAVGTELAADALRANDAGLVAAAVGPFGARHLDQHTWRHAVVKLVFLRISLDAVVGLAERRDAELARMARDLAAERRAAGRDVPADLSRLLPDDTVE